MKQIIMITAACSFAVISARADWFPGDPYKMHYPQLPDPTGWDVDATTDFVYDDWQCTQTGTVSDVHFWMSWQGDNIGQLDGVMLEIWSDVPANTDLPYSHPGDPLWVSGTLAPGQFITNPWGNGPQGWSSPTIGLWAPDDHNQYFQVNITDIANPFVQEEGTVYWLGVHLLPAPGGPQPMAGWKTSQDHFGDDAVYYFGGWNELVDPFTTQSLDMAFVITPEPQSAALAALGACLLCLRRRRKITH